MSAEYVRLAPSEQTYGEAGLLQSQLSLLTMLQQYQAYETLRKEELLLKLELKRALTEAKESLDSLSNLLPESKFLEEQEKKEKTREEIMEKIETAVQTSRKKEWKYWKEKEPKAKEEEKKEEQPPMKEKEEPKSSLDREIEEIRQKLEKLQAS